MVNCRRVGDESRVGAVRRRLRLGRSMALVSVELEQQQQLVV